MHILFLSRWFPYPVENGAKIRIYNLLKGLNLRHNVDLISFFEDENVEAGLPQLEAIVHQVRVVRYKPFNPAGIKSWLGYFAKIPRSVMNTYSEEFRLCMDELIAANQYDLVIASEIDMAIYGANIRGPKKVLEELEISKILTPFLNETNLIKKMRFGLTWWKLSFYVRELLKEYDGSTVVSEEERQVVARVYPKAVPQVIPNGVDCAQYLVESVDGIEPDTLIFNGSITYSVNFQAMVYFIQKILPSIQAKRPKVHLYITGKVTPELIEKLPQHTAVTFTGYLNDMNEILSRCMLCVVPLTVGGGTRLKILEALAAGLPVVSTTVGAEGINLVAGEDILLEDQPEMFADAVVRVLENLPLRQRLSENGRRVVNAQYNWQAINQKFDDYLKHLVGRSFS